jgi:hypothetical protein
MSMRTLELKSLKPNPLRDFTVDPVDDGNVARLKESIKEHGFWSGVVGRRGDNGSIQVAAGWHRVKAAMQAGIKEAQIFVADFDDSDMIRVYATENATQRGNSSTAIAGSVASAVRFLAKAVSTGNIPSGVEISTPEYEKQGIGWRPVVQLLANIPGINTGSAQQQLANIKASGDYARIIDEVRDEIEREHKEAIKAMEKAERERIVAEEAAQKAEQERKAAAQRAKVTKEEAERKKAEAARQKAEIEAKLAEKRRKEMAEEAAKFDKLRTTVTTAREAADKANEREVTFDFEGVAAKLTNPLQIDVFRQAVTSDAVLPYLPVRKQAALAGQLVRMAKDQDTELTGTFIRQNVHSLVLNVQERERKFDRQDREKLQAHGWEARMKDYQHDFARAIGSALGIAQDIIRHNKSRPANSTFYRSAAMTSALDKAKQLCKLLSQL